MSDPRPTAETRPRNLVAVALAGLTAAAASAALGLAGTLVGAALAPVVFVVVKELARRGPSEIEFRRIGLPVVGAVAVVAVAAVLVALPAAAPFFKVPELGPEGLVVALGEAPPATPPAATTVPVARPAVPPPQEEEETPPAAGEPTVRDGTVAGLEPRTLPVPPVPPDPEPDPTPAPEQPAAPPDSGPPQDPAPPEPTVGPDQPTVE